MVLGITCLPNGHETLEDLRDPEDKNKVCEGSQHCFLLAEIEGMHLLKLK